MGTAFNNESNSTISSLRYENESNETHSNGNRAIVQRNEVLLAAPPQVLVNKDNHLEPVEKLQSTDSFSTNDSNSSSKTSPTSSTQNNKTNNSSNRTLYGLQSTLHSIATVLVPETAKPNGSPKYYKRSQTTPNPTKPNKNSHTITNKQNSTGYVNLLGEVSMKDTPYDRVKPKD
jgi:hypothetical protein